MRNTCTCWLLAALLAWAGTTAAQSQSRYLTKAGRVSFFSSSIIEDIEAVNQQAAAVIDLKVAQLAFSIPVKGFVFKRTLMQEHFNENYMESDKFPKATFTGKLVGLDVPALNTKGPHNLQAVGDLTIHGITHRVGADATLELKDGQLQALATFSVSPADYGIEVPLLVRENIAKVVVIRVALLCDPVAAAPAAGAPNTSSRPGNN